MAMGDLKLAGYTGQFGFLLVEGREPTPHYDQEVNLAVHHWEPSFVPMVETMRAESANMPQTTGSDVGYKYATFNGHMLGAGEAIRVRKGERVLMRLLNASATETVVLALPGHSFRVIAMDGNPVPYPRSVEVLSLAVAERIDAIVEMNTPGVWVLGSKLAAERAKGLGVVIEYAGSSGPPVWREPAPAEWDYSIFAAKKPVPEPAETFVLTFRDAGALDSSRFEVTKIGDQPMSGLTKDVINVMPLQTVAVDFVADNPGDALLHCHQQLHMDYGFMQIVKYRG
jgi:FtsP/CotA-like multicopper oxidase with cupredoxin domain